MYHRISSAALFFLGLTVASVPIFAQVDFSGEWAPRFFEDQPERVPGPELGDYLGLPMVDVQSVGAGGGSIARVRQGARLVGPESAGAVPGPVCDGRLMMPLV